MAQLPEDFLSLKSLKSLTTTASIAWIVILVVDVIFISGIPDPYAQLKWIWAIGFGICFILACMRLYLKDEKDREKGDKLFLVFNAALIFLYTSGFNGFTKELASWSELQASLVKVDSTTTHKESNVFGVLIAWTPTILARQTSIWPDVKVLAENKSLQSENKTLLDSLQIARIVLPFDSGALMRENAKLQEEIARLKGEIQILTMNQNDQPVPNMDSISRVNQKLNADIIKLRGENKNLKSDNIKLQDQIRLLMQENKCESIISENAQLNKQVQTLLARINSFNDRQRNWEKANKKYVNSVQEQVNAAVHDKSFYDFLFLTPIETKL